MPGVGNSQAGGRSVPSNNATTSQTVPILKAGKWSLSPTQHENNQTQGLAHITRERSKKQATGIREVDPVNTREAGNLTEMSRMLRRRVIIYLQIQSAGRQTLLSGSPSVAEQEGVRLSVREIRAG